MPMFSTNVRDGLTPTRTITAENGGQPAALTGGPHEELTSSTGGRPLTVAVASSDPQLTQHLAASAAPHAELRWLGALDLHHAPRPEHPAAQARILIVDQALLLRGRSPLTAPGSFADAPATKLVLVADPQDPKLADMLLALRASGCLPPRVDSATLLKALRTVDGGELWLPRHIISTLYARLLATADAPPVAAAAGAGAAISPRVREVLELAAKGLTNKEIALRLDISPSTVKKHLHTAFEKCGLHRRRQLLG